MASLPKWLKAGGLAGAFLVVLALACGGGGNDRTPPGSLEVVNNGNQAMTQLFVTSSGDVTWGVDQLAPSTLPAGGSLTLTQMAPDSYDVQAFFADGSSDEVLNVSVQDGFNTTLTLMNTGTGAVAVFNNSNLTIDGVYLTPSTSTTWGPNQADGPLGPGLTLSLTGVSPATYDLRVIFSDGTHVDNRGFAVTSGTVTTVQVN
jgi:hypothetical protein